MTDADRHTWFARDNAAIAERLEAAGQADLAAVYRDVAGQHAEHAAKLADQANAERQPLLSPPSTTTPRQRRAERFPW